MKLKRILSALLAILMLAGVCMTGVAVSAEGELPFTDVKNNWTYDPIKYVYEAGLMNGTGNGTTFSPNDNLTRGMAVTVLYRNDGSKNGTYQNPFADVVDGKYYSVAAAWAYKNGIVNGTGTDEWGDPYFSPDNKITRQELATMFKRYADFKHIDTTKKTADISKFPDNGKVAGWASDAVKWAVGTELITGKANGGVTTLAPKDNASRAEFAAIIQRYNNKDTNREFSYLLAYETPVLKNSYTEPEYPLVTDADIYVAVDGDDSNPGTLEAPLATFAAAKAKVREIKDGKTGEIKVAFKAGDYGVLDNLTFTSEDSGNDDLTITYCAYGDGPVYFTGGVYINEDEFKPLDDSDMAFFTSKAASSIKKVDLSSSPAAEYFNSSSLLFNDDGFCTVARYPNKDGLIDKTIGGSTIQQLAKEGYDLEVIVKQAADGTFVGSFHDVIEQTKIQALNAFKDRLDIYDSHEGIMICGNISKVWHSDNLAIESYDKETGIVCFTSSPTYGFVNPDENLYSIYISNVPLELDVAGEYWFDPDTKTLYVYAPEGQYLMSYQDTFVTMERCNNIGFRKLNFRGSTDTAINLSYCNGFTFDMCTLFYSGGSYGFHANECINVTITNSELAYFADEGIHITSPRSEYAVNGYHPESLVGDGLVIDNNSIHDIGLSIVRVDTSGIRIHRSVMGQITHNDIYNSSRAAIRFDDCIMLDIAYNHFHDCLLNSADGGAVYSFRALAFRDCNVRYNLFTDIPNKDGQQYAIYNDGAHAWNIYGNVFYNSGSANVVLNGGRDNHVYNNICITTEDFSSIFLVYNSDMIDEEASGELKIGPEEEVNATFNRLGERPSESSPYYDLWYEKWPLLFNFSTDFADVGDYECIYTTINHIKDNVLIGMTYEVEENSIADHFGDIENNREYTLEENPLFVDPTHGDYSLREGADFPDYHFDKIGRY